MTKLQNTITDTITEQIQIATTAANVANTRVLDAVVEANRTAVDFAVKSAERLPSFELPVSLPTPAETGERYLDFVERAVAVNRDLNERVVAMLPTEIKPTAKRTSKKTSAKKTAKKAGASK